MTIGVWRDDIGAAAIYNLKKHELSEIINLY